MTFRLTARDFVLDRTGRAYRGIVNDESINFEEWIEFFNHDARQRRMIEAERNGRPALAGVTPELEDLLGAALTLGERTTKNRRHQAVGVIVRLVMEGLGWEKDDNERGDMTGVSRVFGSAQRYRPVE